MKPLWPTSAPPDSAERERITRDRRAQAFEPNPPRCGTCVYFTLGTHSQRRLESRRGRGIDHLQRCTFGNFPTSHQGVCDDWHSKDGARINSEASP